MSGICWPLAARWCASPLTPIIPSTGSIMPIMPVTTAISTEVGKR